MNNSRDLCQSAVAYLKAQVSSSRNSLSLAPEQQPVLLDLGNGLVVSYVVDEGDRLTYIQNWHLVDAEMMPEELHKCGVENLASLSRKSLRIQPYGAAFAVFLDGNFEASLILVDSLWAKGIRHLVNTEFAVALPARDILAFCDADSAEGISQLREIVSRVASGDHVLSSLLYRQCGPKWIAMAS